MKTYFTDKRSSIGKNFVLEVDPFLELMLETYEGIFV